MKVTVATPAHAQKLAHHQAEQAPASRRPQAPSRSLDTFSQAEPSGLRGLINDVAPRSFGRMMGWFAATGGLTALYPPLGAAAAVTLVITNLTADARQ